MIMKARTRKRDGQTSEPPAMPTNAKLLGMDEAIQLLRTTRPTFYRWLRAGKLKGMKVGRQWRFYREDIERFLKGQGPQIDLPTDLGPLIRALEVRMTKLGIKDVLPQNGNKLKRAVNLM